MLESVQDRRATSAEVFQTVASPQTTDIFLKAAAQIGAQIGIVEIPAQRSEVIDGKAEPEEKSGQEEVMVKVILKTKEQEQEFWIVFDN